jgi:hypothetical protein
VTLKRARVGNPLAGLGHGDARLSRLGFNLKALPIMFMNFPRDRYFDLSP